jgi:thiamine biosynthesis protein ThiI
VIHYGEIGLKGKNRDYFERALVGNINLELTKVGDARVRKRYGRMLIEDGAADIGQVLRFIPGIKYFAKAKMVNPEIEAIKGAALQLAEAVESQAGAFKIAAKRTDKSFPLSSIEVNRVVGAHIVEETGKGVSLENPDLTIYIEIYDNEAYVYREKTYSVGGLPVGTAGRVISLLSGGIDSPVAAFMMMKRGCEVVLLHFFNETIHSHEVRRKIAMLAEILTKVQGRIKLYMVPFGELQREIVKFIPARYRMLVYRRLMMRIANEIAGTEEAKAIATGDSLAQVASQTLENLNVIYAASCYPVLAPLIGFDKEETILIAKEIGTYEVSIRPYEDCCSFMVAQHPETRGRIEPIEELEKSLQLDIEDAIKKAEIRPFEIDAWRSGRIEL